MQAEETQNIVKDEWKKKVTSVTNKQYCIAIVEIDHQRRFRSYGSSSIHCHCCLSLGLGVACDCLACVCLPVVSCFI